MLYKNKPALACLATALVARITALGRRGTTLCVNITVGAGRSALHIAMRRHTAVLAGGAMLLERVAEIFHDFLLLDAALLGLVGGHLRHLISQVAGCT